MAATKKVKVRYAIEHDGKTYLPGSTFDCPADLFESLRECFDTRTADSMPEDPTGDDGKGDADLVVSDRFKFWDKKTKDEIKAELTTRAVAFPDDGTKKELIEILIDAEAQ